MASAAPLRVRATAPTISSQNPASGTALASMPWSASVADARDAADVVGLRQVDDSEQEQRQERRRSGPPTAAGLEAADHGDDHGRDRERREHGERVVMAVRRLEVAQRRPGALRPPTRAGRWSCARTPRRITAETTHANGSRRTRPARPGRRSRRRCSRRRAPPRASPRSKRAWSRRDALAARGGSASGSRWARSWRARIGPDDDQGHPREQLGPEAAQQGGPRPPGTRSRRSLRAGPAERPPRG